MTLEQFRPQFQKLMSWFNKSEKAVNVEMWFDRVKEIPDEAFPSIVNQICDSAKYFPTPQDVRNLFEDWLASHPEKQTVHHRTWCDDCGGTGALRVRIKEKHFTRDSMYRCRACKNWEGSLGTWIPLKYRSELEHLSAVTVLEHREGDRSEQTKKHDFGIPDRPRGGVSHVSEVVAQVSANDSIPF